MSSEDKKTSEEMAEEYTEDNDECEFARDAFLAGYKAAKNQLADADKVMNSSEKPDGWISVKERLPDNALEVIAISNGKSTAFLHKLAYCRWVIDETITHWMPLPEPPKGEMSDSKVVDLSLEERIEALEQYMNVAQRKIIELEKVVMDLVTLEWEGE